MTIVKCPKIKCTSNKQGICTLTQINLTECLTFPNSKIKAFYCWENDEDKK